MQFIGTGDRILTENFNVGYLYTITFKTGIYINSACIGIGDTFVMFQKAEPDLLFTLNMDTADEVDTIELYDSGGGTNDYDDLVNRPQINSHTLTGNMSGADLGLQDTISDLDTIRAGAAAGVTAVQPADMTSALAAKQDTLSAAQLTAVNSGITSTDVAQITTNENNISKQQDTTAQGGNGYAIINGQRLYMSDTAPSGTIPVGSALVSNGKVWGYKASTVVNPTILSDGTAISDYTIKGNTEQNGTPTPSNPVDVVGVGELETSGEHSGEYKIPISSGGVTTLIYFSQQLYKIGDTTDNYVSSGTVEYNSDIYKITGEENWQMSGSTNGWFYVLNLLRIRPDSEALCTDYEYYPTSYSQSGTVPNGGFAYDQLRYGAYEAITIVNTDYNNINDFKQYLATRYNTGNPVTIYYIKQTPTTKTVTATTIPTIEGVNPITFGTALQPSEFDFTAWV